MIYFTHQPMKIGSTTTGITDYKHRLSDLLPSKAWKENKGCRGQPYQLNILRIQLLQGDIVKLYQARQGKGQRQKAQNKAGCQGEIQRAAIIG